MSTLYQNSQTPARAGVLAVRYLDVVIVAVAAPVAIALGAPSFGIIVGAVTWIVQRLVQALDTRWTARLREPRAQLGANLFEAFGRIWLLAAGIIVAGVAGARKDGLAAAIMIFAAYSIAFAIRVISGPPNRAGASR